MTGKATTVFLAAMFASQVALTAVSFADGKKDKGSSTKINLRADLAPPPAAPVAADVSGEVGGEAKYSKKTGKKGTEDKFKGEVEFPVLDAASAQAAVYDMLLFHASDLVNPYAVCSLVIKEIEFEYQSGNPPVLVEIEAEYGVGVSQKTVPPSLPTLKQKVGSCTVFPVVQAGDTATVFLQGDTLSPLLTGTFSADSGDHDDD